MKAIRSVFPIFTLLLFAAACGGNNDAPDATADAGAVHQHVKEEDLATRPTPADAAVQDGVQVVHITVGPLGYEPQSILLKEGIPAQIVFTRTVDSACAEQVQIPAFGVEKTDLPLNEPVTIAFTPDEDGEFAFVCGMEMMMGTVVVRM